MIRLGEWLYAVWAKRHPAPPPPPPENHDPLTCPECREGLRGLDQPHDSAR